MTAYADRGITASQLDFERPFVYLELFAGQLPFSCRMLYARSMLQIRGRICRGMSRSEDIEDSTKDPDVVDHSEDRTT
jgi:hypothetical protein